MSTTHFSPSTPPSAATKVAASLLACGSNSEQVARYFLSLGQNDAQQALRVLNETHDEFDQLFTSVAIHLRAGQLLPASPSTTTPSNT